MVCKVEMEKFLYIKKGNIMGELLTVTKMDSEGNAKPVKKIKRVIKKVSTDKKKVETNIKANGKVKVTVKLKAGKGKLNGKK